MITFKNPLWMIFCYNLRGCVMNKILLIEDNYMIVKAIVYLLKQNNFDVVVSNNLSDSLNYLSSDIDVVILDLMLPDGDGMEFCKYIKEDLDIPVILLTAKDKESDIVKESMDKKTKDLYDQYSYFFNKSMSPYDILARFINDSQSDMIVTSDQIINALREV